MLALLIALSAATPEEPERVVAARAEHEAALIEKVEALGLTWPPKDLHLRAFKAERAIEVWVGGGGPLSLLDTFVVCGDSGGLGPKVQQGDLQIPEGFYLVTGLNPWSPGLLSLQLDYPNAADRARRLKRASVTSTASDAPRGTKAPPTKQPSLGGDIAVHGTCISTGCLAIDDDPIEQIYLLALEPRRRGRAIRVHVYPGRLEPERIESLLEATDDVLVVKLWTSMIPAYRGFERTRRPPVTWSRVDGTYGVAAR